MPGLDAITYIIEKFNLTGPGNPPSIRHMVCPDCGSRGPFRVTVKTLLTIGRDGSERIADLNLREATFCGCVECNVFGKVKYFRLNGLDDYLEKHHIGATVTTASLSDPASLKESP